MTFRPFIALLILAASYPCAAADADKPEAGTTSPPPAEGGRTAEKRDAARKAIEAIKGTSGQKPAVEGARPAPQGGTARPGQEPSGGNR